MTHTSHRHTSPPVPTGAPPQKHDPAVAAGSGTLLCTAAPPIPKGKPCDIRQIQLSFNEIEGGSQEVLLFDTVIAAGGMASLRPRDIDPSERAPARLRSGLAGHDLVVELLAAEALRPSDGGGTPRLDAETRHDKRDALPLSHVQASALVHAKGGWKSKCGDPEHAMLRLSWDSSGDDGVSGVSPKRGTELSQTVLARSATRSVFNPSGFIDTVLNPRHQGREYVIAGTSCGLPAAGLQTSSLSALVIALPAGVWGIEIEFEPLSWELGWFKASDERDEAQGRYADDASRLSRIASGKGVGRRPKRSTKRAGAAAKKKYAQDDAKAVKARGQAVQELASLRPPSNSRLGGDYWETERNQFDVKFILHDRVLSWKDIKDNASQVSSVLDCVHAVMSGSESLVDRLTLAFAFLNDYSPSLVRPSATISIEVFAFDGFFGRKLTSGEGLKGSRWRALEAFWDVEIACKLFAITGSVGVTAGRMLCGTGGTLEFLCTMTAEVMLDYEAKGRAVSFPPPGKEQELKILGTITLAVALIGKAKVLWCEVGAGGATVEGGVRYLTNFEVKDVLEPTEWRRKERLIGDPIVGTAFYSIIGMKRRQAQVVFWKGSEAKAGSASTDAE